MRFATECVRALLTIIRARAFALAREAARHLLGQRPFDEQMVAALALDDGDRGTGYRCSSGMSPFLSLVSDERIPAAITADGSTRRRNADAGARQRSLRTQWERRSRKIHCFAGRRYRIWDGARSIAPPAMPFYDEQAQVQTKEDVLNVLSRMAGNFRTRVGESLAAVSSTRRRFQRRRRRHWKL